MAVNFELSIDTDIAAQTALLIVSQELNGQWQLCPDFEPPDGFLVGVTRKNKVGQSMIQEEFGFCPTLAVRFQVYPLEEERKCQQMVLRATMELLNQITGNAVLLHKGHRVLLQRIGGKLVLNQGWGCRLLGY